MWDERDALDSLLWEAAVDDLGIYPRAVVKDGVEEPRSEYGNGWNACVMAITEKHGHLTSWVKSLTEEQRRHVADMLDADGEPLSLRLRDGDVKLSLCCSDTFCYACADSEDVTVEEMPDVYRLWNGHGYYGVVAWVAKKRSAEPVKEYRYDKGYLAAKADL